MTDQEKVMSWIEGLAQDDWRQFHSDSEVSNIAKAALNLLKEQEKQIDELEYSLSVAENNLNYYVNGNE